MTVGGWGKRGVGGSGMTWAMQMGGSDEEVVSATSEIEELGSGRGR
jgi:hypothetical protein